MIIHLLPIFSLFLCYFTNAQAGHAALCFLTSRLLPETLELAQEFARDGLRCGLDVFIMIDDNHFDASNINTSSNLQLLQIPDELCLRHNYRYATTYNGSNITSWNKALLYFGVLSKNYSFIWLSEDDVFYPSVQAFILLHELYSNTSDLIASDLTVNLLSDPSTWPWSLANGQFIPPWAKSMVNLVGLSRRLLTAATDHIQWLGQVPFHGYLFQTLAIQLNYTIVIPTELSTNAYRASYTYQQINKQPNNIWHLHKHIRVHKIWRKSLARRNLIKNTNVTLKNVASLCHGSYKIKVTRELLKYLLSKFVISKSKLPAERRRLLRQDFSHLAEQCRKRNAPYSVISLAKRLADHAYKLPQPPVEVLVATKSEVHLKLEMALEENRKSIYGLPWNSSRLIKRRNETADLIRRLTAEIQREYKERKELEKQAKLTSEQSSYSSSSITADYISDLLSSNQATNMKMKKKYILPDLTSIQIRGLLADNMEMMLLMLSTFGVLFFFLKRKKINLRRIL